jgi:hypothetical protein
MTFSLFKSDLELDERNVNAMTPQASLSLAAIIFVFLPFPWHWQHGSVATLSLIAWLFVGNLIDFVNAYLWQNNTNIRAFICCDICRFITMQE